MPFALHGYFEDNLVPQAALVFSEVSGLIDNANNKEDGYLSILCLREMKFDIKVTHIVLVTEFILCLVVKMGLCGYCRKSPHSLKYGNTGIGESQ